VSRHDPPAPGEGETLEAYIHRLEAIDPSGLDADEQTVLALTLRQARKKLGAAPGTEPPLEGCKRAVVALGPRDRKQLLLWIAAGMNDPAAPPGAAGKAGKGKRGRKKA
jgi:hypothetical protein